MELPADRTDGSRARRKVEYVPDDPLLTAAEAAAETGCGLWSFGTTCVPGDCPSQ